MGRIRGIGWWGSKMKIWNIGRISGDSKDMVCVFKFITETGWCLKKDAWFPIRRNTNFR